MVTALTPLDTNTPMNTPSDKEKLSPMERAKVRRSCLEDLKKLKELQEEGVLTDGEFEEEKQQILCSLRSLK